ncbi:MAG: hypothetical protein DWH91_00895 [Planctomycetota bacterium]|nr:MAG: hypothetical protein DWH91_00895 [Planctomycetota bacterium]
MRLTLRALLAYLDDVLEPKALRELGARISESPQASSTVARIREIVRRRRIAAPELTGSGSAPDPNLVAEYLDNTLDPQTVPALEKMYLDSDMHLAEVASAHQILTAVLGEPVEVPTTTRERMYALVMPPPPVEPAPVTTTAPVLSPTTEAPSGPIRAMVSPVPPPPMTPDYLKPSGGKSLLVGLLVIVLGGGWMVWVLKEQGFLGEPSGGLVASNDTPEIASPEAGTTDATSAKPRPPVVPATAPNAASGPPDSTGGPLTTITPTVPVEMPAEPAPVEPAPEPTLPNVAVPEVVGLAPQPAPAAEAPAPVTFPEVLYGTPTGVLLIHNPAEQQWIVMPRRTLLHAGDEIACPEPFEAQLQIDGQELAITLFGGTRLQFSRGTETQLLSLKLDRGRIALTRPAGVENQPVVVHVDVRGRTVELSLDPATRCGLEVGLRSPHGTGPDPQLNYPEGGLSVATGSVAVSWQGGPAIAVGADVGWAAWPVHREPFVVGPAHSLPVWMSLDGIAVTLAARRMSDRFEQEFALDQPVSVSMPALVTHDIARISELATYTVGLVDDIPSVVRGLQSKNEETRLAAIYTLRTWLPVAPENAAVLEQEVRRLFPDEDVAAVVALLWGYSERDAHDPEISRKLVDYLGHRDITIRELAIFHIKRLTGRDRDYHANLSDSTRNPAWLRWKDHLDSHGGALLK